MTTVKERCTEMLTQRGMTDSKAEQVLEIAIPKINELVSGYTITWDSNSSDYPDQIYMAIWLSLQEEALDWINANEPNAWYKSMFE